MITKTNAWFLSNCLILAKKRKVFSNFAKISKDHHFAVDYFLYEKNLWCTMNLSEFWKHQEMQLLLSKDSHKSKLEQHSRETFRTPLALMSGFFVKLFSSWKLLNNAAKTSILAFDTSRLQPPMESAS